MKLLRKINKGFILTVIVLIVLIIYLVCVESRRNSEKPAIEIACRDYIELVCEYSVMPKDAQKIYSTEGISSDDKTRIEEETKRKINSQMNKLEKELKNKMIDNELAIDMQKNTVEDFLENNNNIFGSIITSNQHEIKKIKKFAFDDEQVTVTFVSSVEQETKYLNEER